MQEVHMPGYTFMLTHLRALSVDSHHASPVKSALMEWDLNDPSAPILINDTSGGLPSVVGSGARRGRKRSPSTTSLDQRPRRRLRIEVCDMSMATYA